MYLHYAVFLPVNWHPQRRTEKMKRLALAIALACVLSGAARAGEIHSTGAVAPPTPGEIHTTGAVAVAGGIPTNGTTAPETSTSLLMIILTVLSIVP
jgi:hypothetical protein